MVFMEELPILIVSMLKIIHLRFPGREETWYVAEKGLYARILKNAQTAGTSYGGQLDLLAGRFLSESAIFASNTNPPATMNAPPA